MTAAGGGHGAARTAMNRRDFVVQLGGAAAALASARATAANAALPLIGFLGATAPAPRLVAPFLEGLAEAGYVDGRNVVIRYRWADNRAERLPALADELVAAGVAVLVTSGGAVPARAAQAATRTVPIVFEVGIDPATTGLVASLARPGGNATGVYMLTGALNAKRLQYLHEMVPQATTFALLMNHTGAAAAAIEGEVRAAAASTGVRLVIARASAAAEIDAALDALPAAGVQALVVGNDAFFNSRREQLVAAALRLKLPAVFEWRDFALDGGLMSYGSDISGAHRALGAYVARILKGARPADLPVVQPDRFELVINRKTATRLGLTIPQALLLRAEVIE
jgi:putative tryptophan/tyrosine transport system substrate-binding protein